MRVKNKTYATNFTFTTFTTFFNIFMKTKAYGSYFRMCLVLASSHNSYKRKIFFKFAVTFRPLSCVKRAISVVTGLIRLPSVTFF